MAAYDITDEEIINAGPDVVYQAIIDKYNGKTNWWMPYCSYKLLEGESCSKAGSLVCVTIHDLLPVKVTAKTVETKKNEMIRLKYIKGAFSGDVLWKFEELEGKTKVSFRWQVDLSWWLLRMASHFSSIAKTHSDVMVKGYDNLNKYLERKS